MANLGPTTQAENNSLEQKVRCYFTAESQDGGVYLII